MTSRNRGKATKEKASRRYRKPSEEDTNKLLDALKDAPPIGAAILGASLVEMVLEQVLLDAIESAADDLWPQLVGDTGPLSTLNQKAMMCLALGLIERDMYANIDAIRKIRNLFAHPRGIISFVDEDIMRYLKNTNLIAHTYIEKTGKKLDTEIADINLQLELKELLQRTDNQEGYAKRLFALLCADVCSAISWNRHCYLAKQGQEQEAIQNYITVSEEYFERTKHLVERASRSWFRFLLR